MDEPPGARVSTLASGSTARPSGACGGSPQKTVDEEPKWRSPGQAAAHRLQGRVEVGDDGHQDTDVKDANGLVEMAWDPITRIVGSLGIYTKIDFGQRQGRRVPQHVVDLPRLQHLHEGQGPARRPLHHQPHLRHLRRQPRHLLLLRAEHGLRRAPAGARRADRQPRRGRRVHVRPQHLPGEPGRGRLLREDGRRDEPGRARAGQPHRGAARRRPRLQDHRRHHAVAQPVLGRVLPRGAAGQPVHAGDVLPDGGPPRAPVDALPGRRRHHRDHPALHRLLHPAHALRGVHEARRAAARRPVRLLLRGPARLRGGRPPARRCSAAGAPSRTPTCATSTTRT